MDTMDESVSVYELGDKCIVLWKDGNYYTGRVQKVFDPSTDKLRVTALNKGVTVEEVMDVAKVRQDKSNYVPKKVLSDSRATDERWYYVHYFGWRIHYDEWLPIERMLPHTTHNLEIMQQVNAELKERERSKKKEYTRDTGAGKRKKQQRQADDTEPKRQRKTATYKNEDSIEYKDNSVEATVKKEITPETERPGHSRKRRVVLDEGRTYEIRLSVPLELKRILVKDWELITRDREILQLPRPICVREILRDFVNSHKPALSGTLENLEQFYDSIVTYFDYAFGMMLLYRFERNQYYSYVHKDPKFKPSLVYGAEHLARLIVIMPSHLSQMPTMDDVTMKYIVDQANKLAEFMIQRKARYFAGSIGYDAATRVYQVMSIPNCEEDNVNSVKPEEVQSGK